jgi:hypothetical protein
LERLKLKQCQLQSEQSTSQLRYEPRTFQMDENISEVYYSVEYIGGRILWHVEPLLGNDRGISNYTTAVAK